MDKKKVLAAPVPFIAVFGVDRFGRGRPSSGSPAAEMLPTLELPVGVPDDVAYRIRGEARVRAMTVLKALYAKEFKSIYIKERDHLVENEMATRAARAGTSDAVPVGTVADPGSRRIAT